MNTKPKFIEIDKTRIKDFKKIRLFKKMDDNSFNLYKISGEEITSPESIKNSLFMLVEDRIKYISDKQKLFNHKFVTNAFVNNPKKIKEELIEIVEETLYYPEGENLKAFHETIDIIVDDIYNKNFTVDTLVDFTIKDYSTAIHSINVMAFTLNFCFMQDFDKERTKILGLGALLHDTGKIHVSDYILKKREKLTEKEFEEMKTHVNVGSDILTKIGFNEEVLRCAREHHERLNGQGYPNGITNVSYEGQLIGIIDCYEALISYYRPYKSGIAPFNASEIILEDVKKGKYDESLFEKFILTRKKNMNN